MNKVEVRIEVLSYAKSQVGNYVIVLSELSGNRKLPIIIKSVDAQFIAVRMEKMKTPRPMTQDLFKVITDGYGIDIQEIFIHNVVEGIFYAKMSTCNSIENIDVECTIGDALALSVLYNCPIFVSEEVMELSSVNMNEPAPVQTPSAPSTKKIPRKKKSDSLESLNKLLEEALATEDYETAVELRDKIAKLKKV